MSAYPLGPVQDGVYVLPVPPSHPGHAYDSAEGENESKAIDVVDRLAYTRRGTGKGNSLKQYIPPRTIYEESMRAKLSRGMDQATAHTQSVQHVQSLVSSTFLSDRKNPMFARATTDLQEFMMSLASTTRNVDGYPISIGASGHPDASNRHSSGTRFGGMSSVSGRPPAPVHAGEPVVENYSYKSVNGNTYTFVKGRRFPNGDLEPRAGFMQNLFFQCAAELAMGGSFSVPLAAARIALVDDDGQSVFDFGTLLFEAASKSISEDTMPSTVRM